MIKRSLLFTVLLFVVYDLCVRIPQIRGRFIPQSQWQVNLVKAQEFALQKMHAPNIIVGSSLSARLSEADLGPLYDNIGFSGGSALTGIELVSRNPTGVKTVYIETNLVSRKVDAPVIENVFRPVFYELRQLLPSLREKYQPASFFAGKLGVRVISTIIVPFDRFVSKSPLSNGPDEELFSRLLAEQQNAFKAEISADLLNSCLDELTRQIGHLRSIGIRCVLVEMPIDGSLTHLPLAEQIREALKQRFPVSQYTWISPDPMHAYATKDGVHLTGVEARAFVQRIQDFSIAGK